MGLIPALTEFVGGTVINPDEVNANYAAIRTPFNDTAVLTDVARSIGVVHTFNPVVTGAPFVLGPNAANQLVAGLNADQLDSQEASFFRNASNLNAGSVPDAHISESSVTQHQAALSIGGGQISSPVPITGGGTGANNAVNAFDNLKQDATEGASAVLLVAKTSEMVTPTPVDDSAVTPKKLSESAMGRKYVQMPLVGPETSVVTGNELGFFPSPADITGWKIVEVHAWVRTPGTGGVTTVTLTNMTSGNPVLSTPITIESGQQGSHQATVQPVINAAEAKTVAWGAFYWNVTTEHTTPAKGLTCTLVLQAP